jgi:NAD(P)-dependent dehydrogenase (short-subunit alcohol dehydrogenase family)
VILPAIRRAFLASVPAGTPLLVVAPDAAGYAALVAERGDPAVSVLPLELLGAGADLGTAAPADVLLEGLDELAAPAAALQELRARAPHARLHVLVANAAHLPWLAAFFGGAPAPAGHPLVRGEIEALFRAGDWEPQAIDAIADAGLPATVPVEIAAGAIRFQLADAAQLERGRTAGFLVIARPR